MNNLHLFVQVITAVIIILSFAQLFGKICKFIGQPSVVGEMISGVLLGPTLFGAFFPALSGYLFPKEIMPLLFVLSNLGLSIYMFLVGMEMDYALFNKKQISQSSILTISALIFPFILGYFCSVNYFYLLSGDKANLITFSLFMGTGFAITAFPMMARILQERKLLNTKLGSIVILSASIQDVVSWILLSFVTAKALTNSYVNGFYTLIGAFIFIGALILAIRPFLNFVAKRTEKEGIMSNLNFSLVVISLLLSALYTDAIGLYSVFGGFALGLTMPRKILFQLEVKSKLKDFSSVILLPLFFAYSGLNANINSLGSMDLIWPTIIIITVAISSKYLPSLLSMKLASFSWSESFAMAGLVNARGLMELIVINIGIMYGIINTNLYSIFILLAIISTLSAMPLYNLSMKLGEKKKDKSVEKFRELV